MCVCRDTQCPGCGFLCEKLRGVRHAGLFYLAVRFDTFPKPFLSASGLLLAAAASRTTGAAARSDHLLRRRHLPRLRTTLPTLREGSTSLAHTLPSHLQRDGYSTLESETIFPRKTRKIFIQKQHIRSTCYLQAAS